MASATEQLKKLIVKNPKVPLEKGDVCFFICNAQLGKPYDKTTVSTKSGLGIGITLPVTKHFGLGLFKRKVTTSVKTETAWQKTPCILHVLCEKFAFCIGKAERLS